MVSENQNLGLVQYYKEKNSEVGSWIRNTFGLTFLSPQEVSQCFIEDFMSIIPNDRRVSQYADYLTDTYISENSIFPPVIWAESSSSLSRTTNKCESFHSHFKENFYKEKPNIFMWLNIIKQTQSNIYCEIRSIHIPKKSKDYRANVVEQSTMLLLNYKTKKCLVGYANRREDKIGDFSPLTFESTPDFEGRASSLQVYGAHLRGRYPSKRRGPTSTFSQPL
ncbi:hypothetical protein QTP88_010588 [Uroleucon formosanum]